MPRRSLGPRLYLDKKRLTWSIRDGASFSRTGCPEWARNDAEKALAAYIAGKYRPAKSPDPTVADMLLAYAKEHAPHTRRPDNIVRTAKTLGKWWGDKTLSDVNARNCRAYAAERPPVAGLRELEVLRASIGYYHREYGPLSTIPKVILPAKPQPRERWLERDEARRLRKAAMSTPHLYRFIVIALLTGTRPGAVLDLKWDRIDLERGIMHRRGSGEVESKKRRPPVRLQPALVRLLRLWKRKDSGAAYVCHYNGGKVTKLRRSWAAAVKRAGLEDTGVVPHTLRHTRATWMMQEGVDPWEAAGALGMSLQMIDRTYGHHHADYQRRASEV